MNKDLLQKAIEQGGITVRLTDSSLKNAKEITGSYWYYPAYPDKTVIVGEQELAEALEVFVQKNKKDLAKTNIYLGIWRNPKDNNYYIDINERSHTKACATMRVNQINARSNRQIIATYNPATQNHYDSGFADQIK